MSKLKEKCWHLGNAVIERLLDGFGIGTDPDNGTQYIYWSGKKDENNIALTDRVFFRCEFDKHYITINEVTGLIPKNKAKHYRVWSRKGRCPGCGVSTGSRHSKGCLTRKSLLKKINEETISISKVEDTLPDFVNWLVLEDDFIEAEKDTKPEMVQTSLKFLLKKIEQYETNKEEKECSFGGECACDDEDCIKEREAWQAGKR